MTQPAAPRPARAFAAPRSVLVYVGLDYVGDGLIKLPFVRALRAAFPAARITWLAGKGPTVYAGVLAPLVAGLLDEVLPDAGVGSRWTELLRRPLPGRSFDLLIDTQRRTLTTLILRRVRARRFVSAAAEFHLSDVRPPIDYRKPESLVRQLLDLVDLAGGRAPGLGVPPASVPPLPASALEPAKALLPDGPTYVAFAPGAGGHHKCWPLENFVAIAESQSEKGRIPVFILGPHEAEWVTPLRDAVHRARFPLQDAAERGFDTGPLLTIALAGRLAAAVANDAGAGHMLAAGGAPLISLFGPTSAAKFAPVAARSIVIRAQQFGGEDMASIPAHAVANAVEELLAFPAER